MNTRVEFGSTGLQVSPVCFGTWQLSPRFWLDQPKQDILSAMRAAVDSGINFFDTADAYGDGHGMSLYQLVLTATLMHPAIQAAIVGIKTPAQIEEAAGAMGKSLSREDYFSVRKALTLESTRIRDATGTVK